MRTQNVNTLPIVQEGNMLEGLITISDIAKSYMDVYDNAILSTARTQYKNYSGDAGRKLWWWEMNMRILSKERLSLRRPIRI